jgi:hypothetical protein
LSISGWPGTAASTASTSARPAASDSVCAAGSFERSWTSVLPVKLPGAEVHVRPCLPLPASWCSATSQSPSTAL